MNLIAKGSLMMAAPTQTIEAFPAGAGCLQSSSAQGIPEPPCSYSLLPN